jgi:hypothetical protein
MRAVADSDHADRADRPRVLGMPTPSTARTRPRSSASRRRPQTPTSWMGLRLSEAGEEAQEGTESRSSGRRLFEGG